MVSVLLVVIVGLFILMVIGIIVSTVLYNKSFKNNAQIARQTGRDPDDVIWIKDKFRVVKAKGFWIIQFKKLREKTPSVPGNVWTKFIRAKDTPAVIELSDSEWKSLDLTKYVQRGIYFYETAEGEFHPMKIDFKDGVPHFSVMSQENKIWLANEIKDINSLTRNRNKDLLLLGGIVLAILILGVTVVFAIIYLNEKQLDTGLASQRACLDYYYAIQNVTNAPDPGGAAFLDKATEFTTGG